MQLAAVTATPTAAAPPMTAFDAIQAADAKYTSAKESLTSPLELPWDIHASNAVEQLHGAVDLLRPHASGAGFGALALGTSIDHATKAVGLIERAQSDDHDVTMDQMLGSINSAQAALFEE